MQTTARSGEVVERWKRLSEQGVRRRDAARRLGLSEAELVLALAQEGEAQRLRPEWQAILESVPSLGPVMALTRNDACVIEKTGTYHAPEFGNAHVGQVTGPEIDLRIFLRYWSSGFALTGPERYSLEFFAPNGDAVHKIINRDETSRDAFDRIVTRFAAETPAGEPLAIVPKVTQPERPDVEIDLSAYHGALAAMSNTHDFFGVMRRFGLAREQALRLGGPAFAVRVAPASYRAMLLVAAERGVPIMAFVGSEGCIEIHTGPIHLVQERDGYFNVLDRSFNLHLLERPVERAWVVRKPTQSGIISSLEIFDARGDLIVQFFGERHGGPEREDWRGLLAQLPQEIAG